MTKLGPLNPQKTQSSIVALVSSPIGKKLLTGVTGVGLVAFVLIHMLGNLWLLVSRDRFNQYAYGLEQWKPLVFAIELGLLIFVVIHAVLGIQIFLSRLRARPESYSVYQSAGVPSHQTWSSRNMIMTGGALALFVVWHLWTFKFGPVYTTTLQGHSVRDLAQLVIEIFQQPFYTLSYGGVLAVLFLHLRHGLWSALQSVGLILPDQKAMLYWLCNGLVLLLFLGFMSLPIAILTGWIS